MRRCRPLLGTFVEVDCDRPNAIDGAFAEIARIHRLMSAHEPDSDLSRLNRFAHREPVRVDSHTARVLQSAVEWHRRSGGTFDVVRAGGRAMERGLLPRHPGQPAPEALDSSALHVDGDLVWLDRPACIDLGGIAKGYAVDLAVSALQAAGATRGLVNAGGDLFGFGTEPWDIDVADPVTREPAVQVQVYNVALATSALIDGSAAHLPDGTRWSSVTVRAPTTLDADALTKIVWAMGEESAELLAAVGASAFGIRYGGAIEAIGEQALAA